jgi:CubicO group peptidase (beta-lactamase class C family)
VDEDSLWRIKSMTKQATGAAAMMLIEDGVLALDQPVAEILPALRSMRVAVDPERSLASRPAERSITIRHLLTHTSGFSYWIPSLGEGLLPRAYRERGITPGNYYPAKLNQPGYGRQARGLAEMVERLAELPLAFEPGTAWRYSVGADVLGAVIERITGGFEAFLQERLFTPLAMSSTGFQVTARNAARLTSNYEAGPAGPVLLDPGPASVFLRPTTLPAGGAGLVSSARDFMRFGLMLLHGGALRGARVMRPETARLVTSNLLPEGVVSGATISGARGFGAGGAVVLPGDSSPFGTPGSYGGGGAANTLWGLDPQRRLVWLFMSQHMPAERRSLAEVAAAIESDLRRDS